MLVQEGMLSGAYEFFRCCVSFRPRGKTKLLRDILSIVLVSSAFCFSLLMLANAETVSYCGSIPMQVTDWNSSVILPKFNPEMGQLNGVDLKSELNLTQGIALENTNNESIHLEFSLYGGLSIVLPNSKVLSHNVNRTLEMQLSGFDGSLDYSGPSGVNKSEMIRVEPIYENYSAIDDFLAASPGDSAAIPITTTFESSTKSTGSAASISRLQAGANICVTYTFEPEVRYAGGRR